MNNDILTALIPTLTSMSGEIACMTDAQFINLLHLLHTQTKLYKSNGDAIIESAVGFFGAILVSVIQRLEAKDDLPC